MKQELKDIFLDQHSSVPTLTFAFLRTYGPDALTWEPEIVKELLDKDVGVEITEENHNKILSGTVSIYTNAGEIHPGVFEKMCLTSAHEYPDTDVWQPLTPEQLIQGLVDFQILTSREFKPWNDVIAYIKLVLQEHGFSEVPAAVSALANIENTAIANTVNKDEEHQKEKSEALHEYMVEILRVRTEQLNKLTSVTANEQPISPEKE